MILSVFTILMVLGAPFVILKYEKKFRPIEWLSPVVCCYILGILGGNFLSAFWSTGSARQLSEVTVMLALPMLLFSTDLIGWFKLAKSTLISFAIVIFSVMTSALLAGLYFKSYDPEVWKMAGMMVGVYTGGTPNLMAIGKALEVREDVFITLNAVDVVLGGSYLLFIMSLGVKILTRFLPPFDMSQAQEKESAVLSWDSLNLKARFKNGAFLHILSGLAVLGAVLVSRIVTGGESVSVIILGLTLIALLFSFSPRIRNLQGSQELGQYLLLAFCVATGSLANTSQILSGSWWYFVFCGSIMLGSVLLHFMCCFFLKIDRDTAIITSIAGIFGPAFVAPMSQVLKNRAILFSGVTTGLVGYAVGNFVGILVAHLLKG